MIITALVLVALAFLLGYPELLGLAAGALVLLLVSFFLVSGGRPVDVTCSAPPRVERLADVTVRLDLDADRAHRRGLR